MPYKDLVAQREYQREWVARRRARWFSDKECIRCHGTEDLQLRWVGDKLTHRIWTFSQQRFDEEIAKTIVLCRRCHFDDQAEKRTLPTCHGTRSEYRKGCRCEHCKTAHNGAINDYRSRKRMRLKELQQMQRAHEAARQAAIDACY